MRLKGLWGVGLQIIFCLCDASVRRLKDRIRHGLERLGLWLVRPAMGRAMPRPPVGRGPQNHGDGCRRVRHNRMVRGEGGGAGAGVHPKATLRFSPAEHLPAQFPV